MPQLSHVLQMKHVFVFKWLAQYILLNLGNGKHIFSEVLASVLQDKIASWQVILYP